MSSKDTFHHVLQYGGNWKERPSHQNQVIQLSIRIWSSCDLCYCLFHQFSLFKKMVRNVISFDIVISHELFFSNNLLPGKSAQDEKMCIDLLKDILLSERYLVSWPSTEEEV